MPETHARSFDCVHCGRAVSIDAPGTKHRNHCPWCLWSKHVSLVPHDRESDCLGAMEPIGIVSQKDGEWSIVHRCTACGLIRTNRITGDDDEAVLIALALRPLADIPFPLEVLTQRRASEPRRS